MKFVSKLAEILQTQNKRNLLVHLQSMSERQIIDCGFSPELLSEGVKAWPWKAMPDKVPQLRFVRPLNSCTTSRKVEPSHISTENGNPIQQDAA